jgi:hypothetical protein
VNCASRSILLHCYYHLPFTRFIYILANYYLLPLDTLNPLFTANRWDWQPHCKLGQSTLVVLCAGSMLLLVQSYTLDEAPYINCPECREASEHQPSEGCSFSYWFDKPWFHTKGRLAAVLIIPSSWVSQLGGHWYVSNVSIIFDAPCLFLHHLPIVSLHLVVLLYIFRN